MKKQIRKLLHRFENLKFRKKLSVLMLIVGLVPVVFLAFSMQYGMTNQLREKEQYNLEKILEQSVNSIENQSQIYENLVDYLSYSQSLRNIFDTEMESDYEKYLKYVKVADPLLQMPTIYHKEIRSITLYSDNIEVPHGDTLLPMSEAENTSGCPNFHFVKITFLKVFIILPENHRDFFCCMLVNIIHQCRLRVGFHVNIAQMFIHLGKR